MFYMCAITVLIRYKCFISVLKSVCFRSVLSKYFISVLLCVISVIGS